MFLKNVPPVVALHTEWRSYGPKRNFSLPLCFNDSDSDISTSGTPIPEKVQMIIDSLRNTESSIDMSDEYEGILQTGQAPPPGCSSKTVDVGHRAGCRGTLGGAREDDKLVDSLELRPQSHDDSDSDDSVDRGIEEAIQEYLKKKGEHKRKLDLTESPSLVSKQMKRECPLSDSPKHLDSNIILAACSNHFPQSVKAAQSVVTERKRMRNEENPPLMKRGDVIKAVKTFPSFETQKCHIQLSSHSSERQKSVTVKLEEESSDSSSDDGIEEAIRHYQLEKIKENSEDVKKPCKFSQPSEESDSSSDDGIEEAIRCYQLEKQKEDGKLVTKASKNSRPKQSQGIKVPAVCLTESLNVPIKKQKVFTKKRKTDKSSKPVLSATVAPNNSSRKAFENPDLKDLGNSVTKFKNPSEKLTPAPLKVNTTAELMCAEAILDISKAVMPEAFQNSLATSNNCGPSIFHSRDGMNIVENKTDESSVDSDDGIEQEIRKFLELKAQMHSQSSSTATFPDTQAHAMSLQQKKVDSSQNKKLKLSMSHKRKSKDDYGNTGKMHELDSKFKGKPHPKPLSVHDHKNFIRTQTGKSEESIVALHVDTVTKKGPTKNDEQKSASVSLKDAKDLERESNSHSHNFKNEASKSLVLAERRALTGDKSSSFDSDEDLDAAIKDLLLTKKKVKRKIRDRKLKSRKCADFTAVDLHPVEELDSERRKTPLDCKPLSSAKNTKSCISKSSKVTPKQSTDEKSIGPKLSKNTSGKLKDGKIVKHSCQSEQMNEKKGHTNVDSSSRDNHVGAAQAEDSSSVDSDDSIEQEIRKFLAEKAKSSVVRTNDAVETKQEAQQAEIPQTAETLDRGLPGSTISAQVGRWEEEVLKTPIGVEAHVPHSPDEGSSLSEAVISDSSSILQPDKEANITKEMKSLNSHTEQNGLGMEKVLSDPEISPVLRSDNTDIRCADLVPLSVTQLGAALSRSPFLNNPPTRDRARRMMNTSDLHVPAHDTSDTMHPAQGTHEIVNHNELMVPSSQSIAAIPRFAIPAPARQTNTNLRLGEAGRMNLGHASAPSPAGNVIHGQMDLPVPSERSSHGYNYVQIKSRDRSESVDEKYYSREREEGKRKGGDFLREEYEECIDETDDESEESPSTSQSSKGKKQFPRLVLSTTIDPGESFKPYIILNSPERNLRFSKRSMFVKDQQSHNLRMHADIQKEMSHKGRERMHPSYAVNVKTFYSRTSPCILSLPKKAKSRKLVKRKLLFHTRKEETIGII